MIKFFWRSINQQYTEQKEEEREFENGLLRAMKKKIVITIQTENQCKDIVSSFF